MKIRKKLLENIRKVLPVGAAKTIRQRIIDAKNLEFSTAYIYRVLDPDDASYNTIIVEETVAYVEELSKKKKILEERILEAVS